MHNKQTRDEEPPQGGIFLFTEQAKEALELASNYQDLQHQAELVRADKIELLNELIALLAKKHQKKQNSFNDKDQQILTAIEAELGRRDAFVKAAGVDLEAGRIITAYGEQIIENILLRQTEGYYQFGDSMYQVSSYETAFGRQPSFFRLEQEEVEYKLVCFNIDGLAVRGISETYRFASTPDYAQLVQDITAGILEAEQVETQQHASTL